VGYGDRILMSLDPMKANQRRGSVRNHEQEAPTSQGRTLIPVLGAMGALVFLDFCAYLLGTAGPTLNPHMIGGWIAWIALALIGTWVSWKILEDVPGRFFFLAILVAIQLFVAQVIVLLVGLVPLSFG
jgi:hypothetical protein